MAHDHTNHEHSAKHAPLPQPKAPSPRTGGIETVLSISGMDCPDEITVLERALLPIPGVQGVVCDLIRSRTTISHSPAVTVESLISAVGATGMKAQAATGSESPHAASRTRTLLVVFSGFLTAVGLVIGWAGGPPLFANVLFGAAIVSGGWFIFPKAVGAARRLSPDMNLLMVVAVLGAAGIGEWGEGAAVTFLFGLSELLEAFSVRRARRAIESLLALAPETALVRRSGTISEVSVRDVQEGETVVVKSGQRIPLDGEITSGTSAVNQAPITGESLPVEKKPGDGVYAGTINSAGSLEVRVTKASGDTMLARIVKLVGEAQAQKAPSQRFVDVFAKIYTPSVMVIALLVFLLPPLLAGGAWNVWLYRALVLLVIACPCALVIATPVSIVSGLTAMARQGVLIKGGAHLESLGKLRALAVDKTGTITEGRPRVLEVIPFSQKTPEFAIGTAAAIDTHSEHPLARAVVDHAVANSISVARATDYSSITGRGATATVDGVPCFVGNHRFAHELGVCTPELESALTKIESQGLSVVVVGSKAREIYQGEVYGVLAIGDAIRPNAAAALSAIHAAGIEKVVMLSGDNQRTAEAIAKQANIDQALGDLLPDDKIGHVRKLLTQYLHVGMIGDGVNDAPAMAAASIGIAMGKAGTDTAIETADVALMQDDLSKVADAIKLGRRTVRIIQFNIAFSLAVKAVFLLLALFGHTSLWFAILADTGATLIVTANALRLLRGS